MSKVWSEPSFIYCLLPEEKALARLYVEREKEREREREREREGGFHSNPIQKMCTMTRNIYMKATFLERLRLTTCTSFHLHFLLGAQWLSGRVLDLRPRGRGFELHRRHCVVVLEQDTFILA